MIIPKRASRTKKEALLLFFRVFHHTFQGQRIVFILAKPTFENYIPFDVTPLDEDKTLVPLSVRFTDEKIVLYK